MSPKAPSSVLLNPDKSFKSFGYTAEKEYSSLFENGQHQEWYFFTNIKMKLLYHEKISRTATIDDECGKPMLGLTILSMIIRHLKEDLFKRLEQRGITLKDEDLLWVLTVPAILPDAAKQFTKEAAEKAGIKSDDVRLVYEPEAAALYCRFQNMQNISNATDESNLLKKKKMLVFDMGDVFEELREVLSKHGDIECVLAVGGLAQSPAVVSEIRKYFKDIPVYVPFDSSLAVVSGAVLYGHENNIIKTRVCPYSYGIQTMRPFVKGDDETKKVVQEGETWCKHSFRALYKAGDLVKLGDVASYNLMESFEDENRKYKRFNPIRCVLFTSKERDVRYVTDEGCKKHGTIDIEVPVDGFPVHYKCTIELEFAGTEIVARLKDKTGTKTIRLEFMN